jgi:hypothetical protein
LRDRARLTNSGMVNFRISSFLRSRCTNTVKTTTNGSRLSGKLLDSKDTKLSFASICAVSLLFGLAASPIFLVDIPAVPDYPNHLARMYILAASGTREANPYYTVHWSLVPNLAIDLFVPVLAQFTGVAAATKIFLVLSQALIVSGSVALELVVQKRHYLAGFVAVSALYAVPFTLGLLNSEFGIGVALWGIAFWILLENRAVYIRLLVHSMFVCCLYIAHLIAMGLYGAVIGFYVLARFSARSIDAKNLAVTVTILAGPAVAVFGYLVLSGTQVGNTGTEWIAVSKLFGLFYLMNGYSAPLAASSFSIILLLFYVLYKSRSISFVPEGKWIACGLLILFILMPFKAAGSAYDDTRIATAALMILPAFLIVSSKSRIIRVLPPITFSVIALVNSGQVASVWLSYRPEYNSLKSSFGLLHHGAFVLVAQSEAPPSPPDDSSGPLLRYAPVLAVHYSGAFVPSLFSLPGMYVVQVSERLTGFEITNSSFYDPIPFQLLRRAANDSDIHNLPSFVQCWTQDYDYLYLVGQVEQNPMPSRLVPLIESGRFALYRIQRDSTFTTIPQSTFDMQRSGSGCPTIAK